MGQANTISGCEPTENYEVRAYDDISPLLAQLGDEDDWAARIAPYGDEYTLDDGTSVWIGSFEDAGYEGDDVFALVGKDERHGHYRLVEDGEARLRAALDDSGIELE